MSLLDIEDDTFEGVEMRDRLAGLGVRHMGGGIRKRGVIAYMNECVKSAGGLFRIREFYAHWRFKHRECSLELSCGLSFIAYEPEMIGSGSKKMYRF